MSLLRLSFLQKLLMQINKRQGNLHLQNNQNRVEVFRALVLSDVSAYTVMSDKNCSEKAYSGTR